MAANGVKFIRVHGRVVPIHQKSDSRQAQVTREVPISVTKRASKGFAAGVLLGGTLGAVGGGLRHGPIDAAVSGAAGALTLGGTFAVANAAFGKRSRAESHVYTIQNLRRARGSF